jgi:hypothetical protein
MLCKKNKNSSLTSVQCFELGILVHCPVASDRCRHQLHIQHCLLTETQGRYTAGQGQRNDQRLQSVDVVIIIIVLSAVCLLCGVLAVTHYGRQRFVVSTALTTLIIGTNCCAHTTLLAVHCLPTTSISTDLQLNKS